MSRIFVTGSTDGLGLLAARRLLDQGHDVVLHARTPQRADDVRARVPQASDVVVGDLSTFTATTDVAAQVNELGRFDAVIHNAGIAYNDPRRTETRDGITTMFAVNVVARYLLTALVTRPARLVYLSSGMRRGADASLDDPQWTSRRWSAAQAYSDSKAHLTSLALAVARRWPDPATTEPETQDALLADCRDLTGVDLPGAP